MEPSAIWDLQSRIKEYLIKWILNPLLFTSRFQIWKSKSTNHKTVLLNEA